MSVVFRTAPDVWWSAEAGRLKSHGAPAPGDRVFGAAYDSRAVVSLGWTNAHTHLYSGLAGLSMPPPQRKPESFVQILERVWWRLDRALDAKLLRASARFALAEGLLFGTTSVVDHHESPGCIEGSLDVLADAAQELGVRLAVAYGATGRNGGRAEEKRGLAECARFVRSNRRPLVKGLVGLHASFTVSDECVREAGALAKSLGVGVHVHVAEDGADVQDAMKRGYAGPLERLFELGALPKGSLVAHGVHLTPEQLGRAHDAGLTIIQNPRSNEGNHVGYARGLIRPAGERAPSPGRVALGTDGWPSDMDAELAALLRLGAAEGDDLSRLKTRRRSNVVLADELWGGTPGEDTPWVPGQLADVVIGVPDEKPRHVFVAGKPVVLDGQLVTADIEEIRAEAREAAPELWRRMSELAEP